MFPLAGMGKEKAVRRVPVLEPPAVVAQKGT